MGRNYLLLKPHSYVRFTLNGATEPWRAVIPFELRRHAGFPLETDVLQTHARTAACLTSFSVSRLLTTMQMPPDRQLETVVGLHVPTVPESTSLTNRLLDLPWCLLCQSKPKGDAFGSETMLNRLHDLPNRMTMRL